MIGDGRLGADDRTRPLWIPCTSVASGDRAVSTAVGYVLILGVIALLISSLFIAIGPFVAGQSEQTTRSSMDVVANQLASDLKVADRLADRGDTVEYRANLPKRVSGSQYEVSVENGEESDQYEISLRSIDPEAVTSVTIRTNRPVAKAADLSGGPLLIEYDSGELVIHEA